MLLEQMFKKYAAGYVPPLGTLSGSFEEMKTAGCIQADFDSRTFTELMGFTGNNVCDGCPVWRIQGPVCKAFQQYHSAYTAWKDLNKKEAELKILNEKEKSPNNAPIGHPLFGKSMKQIAAALNISLSEARRRKQAGTLFS